MWLPASARCGRQRQSAPLLRRWWSGPLFFSGCLWSRIAPVDFAQQAACCFCPGRITRAVGRCWAPAAHNLAERAGGLFPPWRRSLGYALLAPRPAVALRRTTIDGASGCSCLATGWPMVSNVSSPPARCRPRLQQARQLTFKGASQTMPLAMFAFASPAQPEIRLPPWGLSANGYCCNLVQRAKQLALGPLAWLVGTLAPARLRVFPRGGHAPFAVPRSNASDYESRTPFAQWGHACGAGSRAMALL